MRPSGTEAKMKIYLEVARGPIESNAGIKSEKAIAEAMIIELGNAVSEIPNKLLG
jgi:phosphomannomutase